MVSSIDAGLHLQVKWTLMSTEPWFTRRGTHRGCPALPSRIWSLRTANTWGFIQQLVARLCIIGNTRRQNLIVHLTLLTSWRFTRCTRRYPDEQ